MPYILTIPSTNTIVTDTNTGELLEFSTVTAARRYATKTAKHLSKSILVIETTGAKSVLISGKEIDSTAKSLNDYVEDAKLDLSHTPKL